MAGESPFLVALSEALSTGLASEGFVRAPALDTVVDGKTFRVWTRDRGWKRDAIELSAAARDPVGALVHLRIYVPCGPGAPTVLTGTTVAGVVGRRGTEWFPNFFGRPLVSLAPRFARRVLTDTRAALAWFDEYATADACLARLDAGDTSWGLARGQSYQALATFLRERLDA